MTTTLREFQRSFRRMRIAADSGREIVIRERNGAEYVFKASKPAKRQKTFWELAGHHCGSVKSGKSDLSTNKKYFANFGRD
jgi:hypothetical protein